MVAMHGGYADLFRADPDLDLHVLEEEYFHGRNEAGYADYGITELRLAPYQQDSITEVVRAWHAEVGFDAIVPAAEYAVGPAFRAAAALGLPTPGEAVVEACTDKLRMRNLAGDTGVRQPRFAPASTLADVEAFFSGTPVVVKPTNRRASVGVALASTREDLAGAFARSTSADEPVGVVDRPMSWGYMVEEFVEGPEVSVETVIVDGSPVFHNVTAKTTVGGGVFTEVGHVVPAPIATSVHDDLVQATEQLLSGLGARAGVFHSEWKTTSDGPVLIECACRPPGDLIPELVRRVHGIDLYAAYVRSLAGLPVAGSPGPTGVAAIHYFTPAPGVVRRIDGVDTLAADPRVFDWDLPLDVGQEVPSFESSWQRAGYFAVHETSHVALEETRTRLTSAVEIELTP